MCFTKYHYLWLDCGHVTQESAACDNEWLCRWAPDTSLEMVGDCPSCLAFPGVRLPEPERLRAIAEFKLQMAKEEKQRTELAEDEESKKLIRKQERALMSPEDRDFAEKAEALKERQEMERKIREEERLLCRIQSANLNRAQTRRLVVLYVKLYQAFQLVKPSKEDTTRAEQLENALERIDLALLCELGGKWKKLESQVDKLQKLKEEARANIVRADRMEEEIDTREELLMNEIYEHAAEEIYWERKSDNNPAVMEELRAIKLFCKVFPARKSWKKESQKMFARRQGIFSWLLDVDNTEPTSSGAVAIGHLGNDYSSVLGE